MNRPAVVIRVLIGALFVLPIVSVALVWVHRDEIVADHQVGLPVMSEVGDFSMTEASGKTITKEDLLGKVWVASFVLTRCSGSCPIITHNVAQLQKQLPARDDFRLVSVSVDPDHDTPAILAAYAAENKADRSGWWFLTGPKSVLYPWVRNSFKLGVDDTGGTPDEPVNHSTKLVLVDRRGQIRGYYDGTDIDSIKKLAHDINHLVSVRS